VIDQN
jgi:hypothetical protein